MDSTKSDMNNKYLRKVSVCWGSPNTGFQNWKNPKTRKAVKDHSLVCNLDLHSQFQKQVYCFKRKEFFKTGTSVSLQKLDFYALGFYFLQQNLMESRISFSFSNIIGTGSHNACNIPKRDMWQWVIFLLCINHFAKKYRCFSGSVTYPSRDSTGS